SEQLQKRGIGEGACFHSNGLITQTVEALKPFKLFVTDLPAKPNTDSLRDRRVRTGVDDVAAGMPFDRGPDGRLFSSHYFCRGGSGLGFRQFNPPGKCQVEE